MTTIKYAVDVQVTGGPRLNFNDKIEVDAYDRLDVVVPKGGAEKTVEVQPGAAGAVRLLVIRSSDASADVSFKNGAGFVGLENPVLLAGGAVGMLDAAPQEMKFKNETDADVTVTIIVGRDATA